MSVIKSILIANRGEIACRIIRTARRLGVRTVAVYSDADASALHVHQADEAVHIGPSPARESYLVGEAIIVAAKATGAEGIHPGYGFLSENADFAQAVLDSGLIWIGPAPDSIRAMGLKDAAKARMIAAGVPVTPGYLGEDQSATRLQAEADAIGYPVLIKAVAGGGGKGMRRVDSAPDFAEALVSCRREAASSFGDDRVLIEKYVLSPRHIEVQVFGDSHGNVVHLFERDCSLQRRHQKVIEEAPAPGMDEATRAAICAAAVRAARAVDYVGAGTIEFIADASEGLRADRIWFMEMNTRLQVEHPVTEEITGQDLVEWQLRVASGEMLPRQQHELSIHGWAMEARLYAEDPAKGFLPSVGQLEHFHLPSGDVRLETGVEQGSSVSPYYDPMIAKIVVAGSNRSDTVALLQRKLEDVAIWPVKTNAGFLWKALDDAAFREGAVTTGFIADRLDTLLPSQHPSDLILGQAALALIEQACSPHRCGLACFRLNGAPNRRVHLEIDGQIHEVDAPRSRADNVHLWSIATEGVLVSVAGESFGAVLRRGRGTAAADASSGAIISPMPGRVIALDIALGDIVTKGQRLLTLEAMKMEHVLTAPFDGTVAALAVELAGQVSEGSVLVSIEAMDES
jgi:3-methylcrotonyl-CoA carboxylase alpha subunit